MDFMTSQVFVITPINNFEKFFDKRLQILFYEYVHGMAKGPFLMCNGQEIET